MRVKSRAFHADGAIMTKGLIFFCIWTCCAAQDGSQLVGRWRSVETSKGGIGAMYDFGADGTVHFSPGAIVPTQYRLEGDRLTLSPSGGVAYTLSWNGDDHMKLTVNGAGSEEYNRLGAEQSPRNKLVGEWTGREIWMAGRLSSTGFSVRIPMRF